MAKTIMPLMSGGASGKIADMIVFFPWKGHNVVRQWLKPANPMTGKQGDQRLFLGGTGRACKVVQEGSYYIGEGRALATGGQTWVSALVNYIISNIFTSATAYEAVVSAYNSHGAKSAFASNAASLGLTDFDVDYKSTTSKYVAGLQLYILALYGVNMHSLDNEVFNKSPYTKALNSWTSDDVGLLVDDLQAA